MVVTAVATVTIVTTVTTVTTVVIAVNYTIFVSATQSYYWILVYIVNCNNPDVFCII